jgi:hypothetical protein
MEGVLYIFRYAWRNQGREGAMERKWAYLAVGLDGDGVAARDGHLGGGLHSLAHEGATG